MSSQFTRWATRSSPTCATRIRSRWLDSTCPPAPSSSCRRASLPASLATPPVNEHSRQVHAASAATARPTPLGLDLHFLLSAWAGNARDEHTIVAWAVRQLHMFPILDASSLSPEAGWGTNEVIQIIPAELSTEDVMRIWDALDPPYRLSVSYIARLVRLDPDTQQHARPVVTTRFAYGEEVRA